MDSTRVGSQLAIIDANPIGDSLSHLRDAFRLACGDAGVPFSQDAMDKLDQLATRRLIITLLATPQILTTATRLASTNDGPDLLHDISRLRCEVAFGAYKADLKPLLTLATADHVDDKAFWGQVYHAAVNTPPAIPRVNLFPPVPWVRLHKDVTTTTEGNEYAEKYVSGYVGPLLIGVPLLWETFFGQTRNLAQAANVAFQQCSIGENAPFADGKWAKRPNVRNQYAVLTWLRDLVDRVAIFANAYKPAGLNHGRRCLARPSEQIQYFTKEHKVDFGFVNDPLATEATQVPFSKILVPGVLKRDAFDDTVPEGWMDMAWSAKAVITADDERRFVLGFSLCGNMMRVWLFDRLGGLASDEINIDEDGVRFVATLVSILWMDSEQLGSDPTIKRTETGERFIEMPQNGSVERLFLGEAMHRTDCLAGRATKCWRVYKGGHSKGTPLALKESWQCVTLPEEGILLRDITARGVINVARYSGHWTERMDNVPVNVISLRRGLNIGSTKTFYPRNNLGPGFDKSLTNRVQRRVVIKDCGRPIYKASAPSAVFGALEACIEGCKSLHAAGFLHRDISEHNILINEDTNDPSWRAFLIDFDVATSIEDMQNLGTERLQVGTREFMALGVLLGEPRSFMHDLESFFWVLVWICTRYVDMNGTLGPPMYEKWFHMGFHELAEEKSNLISSTGAFLDFAEESFMDLYGPTIRHVDKLRGVVFPSGRRWEREDLGLYDRMRAVLKQAQTDLAAMGW